MTAYLDELAWNCWCNDKSLVITKDIESHTDYLAAVSNCELKIHEGNLSFSNEENLVKRTSRYLINNILTFILDNPSAVFSQLFEVGGKEISVNDKVSCIALASLHNEERIDLFNLAAAAIPSFSSVFDIIHVMEGTIPLVNDIKSESLFRFARSSYDKLKRDYMGGNIYDVLMSWLVNHPRVADEIIRSYIKQPEVQTATLYRGALIVMSQINLTQGLKQALDHSNSINNLISAPAVEALGFVQYKSPEDDVSYRSALELATSLIITEDPILLNSAATATWRLIQQRPHENNYLQHLIAANKPETYYALSQFLLFNVDKLSGEPWFDDIVYACVNVQPDQKGIIDNIDLVLSSLLKKYEKQDIAISFLEKWLLLRSSAEVRELDLETIFNSAFYETNRRQLLSQIFTSWMFHESGQLAEGAFQLIKLYVVSGGKELSYDIRQIEGMSANDIVYLVRKTLGYIFEEGLLHSLIWSLTKSKPNISQALRTVHEVFITHLGYDYPSFTIKFIEDQLKKEELPEIKKISDDIVLSIKNYHKALDALPQLKELKPSHSKVRLFSKERQKQMSKASEAAQEKSVFAKLVTRVHLKAGRSSFSWRDNNLSEKMHLSTHSYSVSLPRSEMIDPVGSSRKRLMYRKTEKIPS